MVNSFLLKKLTCYESDLKAGKSKTPLFIEIKEDSDSVKPLQYYRRKELIRLGFESIIIDK